MAQLLARLEELAAQVDPTQWADARVQGAGARLGGGGGQTPPGAPLPADEFQRLCGRVVPTLNDASRLSAALVPFLARAAADPAGSGGNGTGGGWRPQSVGRPALPAPRGEAAPSTRQESPPRPSRGGGGGGGGDQEWLNMVQTTVDQGIAATLGTAQPGVHQDVLSALSSALRHALQSPRST